MKHLYIGGYGPGILTVDEGLTPVPTPTFLAAHPTLPILYAVTELGEAAITAFSAEDGLTLLESRSTEGTMPCHVAVHPSGELLAVANYGDGTAFVQRLDGGGGFAGEPIVLRHQGGGPVTERQECAHAHQAVFHDGILHVPDLGTDEIRRYTLEGEALESIKLPPGTGPRHIAFAGSRLYVAGELDGIVTMIDGESTTGTLASRKDGVNHPSHLELNGGFVYVANRGPDTISVFDAADLSPVAEVPAGGEWPRHFAIDGDTLYVANQHSNAVVLFTLKDGVPEPTGREIPVEAPGCVLPW
ncbi:lactonase family protein [Nonomuraea sp. NPDC050536]|uniref:lactonase family protein n=1 Tax=Nonomuraea sp. NPDC050536 TaxID=3364366 RepID=UPI0037C5DF62